MEYLPYIIKAASAVLAFLVLLWDRKDKIFTKVRVVALLVVILSIGSIIGDYYRDAKDRENKESKDRQMLADIDSLLTEHLYSEDPQLVVSVIVTLQIRIDYAALFPDMQELPFEPLSDKLRRLLDAVPTVYDRGVILAALTEFDSAAIEFRRARVEAPNDSLHVAMCVYMVGVCQWLEGDSHAAVKSYEMALRYNPAMTKARFALYVAYDDMGHPDTALTIIQRIVADGDIIEELADVTDAARLDSTQRADPGTSTDESVNISERDHDIGERAQWQHTYKSAVAGLFVQDLYDSAKTLLEDYLELYPQDAEALYTLGLAFLKLVETHALDSAVGLTKALNHFDSSIVYNFLSCSTWTAKGSAHAKLGMYDSSIASYLQAESLGEKSHMLYLNLGQAYQKIGKDRLAVTYYLRSLERNPFSFVAHRDLAIIYYNSGNCQDAKEHAATAFKLQSASPDTTVLKEIQNCKVR